MEFPGDTPGDQEERVTEGDYFSRMHRKVKARIRELSPEYQYPRSRSFYSLVNMLITLGLVEKSGRQEEAEERGAGALGVLGGFQLRTWVRLTPGSLTRIEWADPVGHVARLYPNVRKAGQPLPGAPPASGERPAVPTITLPGNFSTRTVPRLMGHLEELLVLAEEVDWPEEPFPALSAEVEQLFERAKDWRDNAQDSFDAEQERGGSREDVLEERVNTLDRYVEALDPEEEQDLGEALEALGDIE